MTSADLRLIDASSRNPTIDWRALHDGGYGGAIIKATEGSGYHNPLAPAQLAGARAQQLVVGHYGFARQDQDPTPEGEADYLLSYADVRPGELVCLDFEQAGGTNLAAWALGYLGRLEYRLGYGNIFLYSYPNYIQSFLQDARLARYPLWFASYDRPTWPAPPAPWSQVVIWQDAGDAVGVPGCGEPTDTNRFRGTADDLRAYGWPGTTVHDFAAAWRGGGTFEQRINRLRGAA